MSLAPINFAPFKPLASASTVLGRSIHQLFSPWSFAAGASSRLVIAAAPIMDVCGSSLLAHLPVLLFQIFEKSCLLEILYSRCCQNRVPSPSRSVACGSCNPLLMRIFVILAFIPEMSDVKVSKEAWLLVNTAVESVMIALESGASPMASRLFPTDNPLAAAAAKDQLFLLNRVAVPRGLGARFRLNRDDDLR